MRTSGRCTAGAGGCARTTAGRRRAAPRPRRVGLRERCPGRPGGGTDLACAVTPVRLVPPEAAVIGHRGTGADRPPVPPGEAVRDGLGGGSDYPTTARRPTRPFLSCRQV